MSQLKSDNVRAMQKAIAGHPQHFYMGEWVDCKRDGTVTLCMAGFGAALGLGILDELLAARSFGDAAAIIRSPSSDRSSSLQEIVRVEAVKYLGFRESAANPYYEDDRSIFTAANWPEPIGREFQLAKPAGKAARVAVVCALIDLAIEAGTDDTVALVAACEGFDLKGAIARWEAVGGQS